VHEVDVPLAAVAAARRLYESAVVANLGDDPGSSIASSAGTFYLTAPPRWGYSIKWVYGGDKEAHAAFEDLFTQCGTRAHFQHADEAPVGYEIRVRHGIRLYAGSFVVRSSRGLTEPFFHEDFNPRCGTEAYTFMTPLYDMSQMHDGHLLYHDIDGEECVYRYKVGKSIQFGAGFSHATQPCSDGEEHPFLCFNFGTDDLGAAWYDAVGNLPIAVLQLAREAGLALPVDLSLHMKLSRVFRRANKSGSGRLTVAEFQEHFGHPSAAEARELLDCTDLGPHYVFEQLVGEETSMSEISFTAAFCHQIALRKASCKAANQSSGAEL
jgi:hypothetical protein